MSSYQGFWSYAHEDDEAEQGRISRLARDVVAQYELLTGETIDLFLDRDALEWGDDWRDKIDAGLAAVAFFIPVITPRFFMSPECRKELQFFARRADKLGVRDLVLSVHYADVAALRDDSPQDDLVALVRKFQWVDWRELRFADVTAGEYRRAVAELAARLAAANRSAEESGLAAATLEADRVGAEEEDGAPGTLDRMALAEESLPRWTQTTQDIVAQIEAIGRAMQEANYEMNEGPNRADKSFAHKLIVARQLAKRLEGPSEEISASVTTFVSQLHDVDDGFRAIIERAPAEIEENPDSRKDFCHFFRVVENLSAASSEGLGSARSMIEAIPPIEKTSRDLRPVLRRLRSSLVAMVEAKDVTDSWVGLIEGSGVDCRGLDDQRAQAPEE